MRRIILLLSLTLCLLMTACTAPWQRETDREDHDGYVYYLNDEHTDLVRVGFNFNGKSGQVLADDIAQRLSTSADDEYDSPLPDGVVIEGVALEEGHIRVTLNGLYAKASRTDQTLCRAALVESFTQVPDVSGVRFFVDDQPMDDGNGTAYDLLKADDFLYSSSIYPEQSAKRTLTLYFGDSDSEHLKKESVTVKTSGEKQLVRIIVERLIAGPAFEEETELVPPNTQVISATLVDKTAYINLDDGFSDSNVKVAPELAVYSIVNSVIDNTAATSVQIQINGRTPVSYGGQINLRQPLEAKKSLIR